MISSLRQRNYRLFFFGQLVSVAGTWMQTVAQSFVVLDLTHSGTQLGLTTAVRFLPMFLFGPLGGVFADRMDKRRVLYLTQSLAGLLAAAFAVLVGTGNIATPQAIGNLVPFLHDGTSGYITSALLFLALAVVLARSAQKKVM